MGKFSKIIFVFFFIAIGFFAKATFAEAASRFWVGGTGNWDASDTTHWAATSGGGGGASVPGSGDTVTLDGSSGGGTVTVTAAVNVTSITMGAFTGTLDLNGQTIDVVTFSLTGTGTRTLTMGASAINISGTGTVWAASTMTNCTITANTATLTFSGANPTFSGASGTNWNGLSLVSNSSGTFNLSADAPTFANITSNGAANKTSVFSTGRYTVTGTLTFAGNSSTNRLLVQSNTSGTTRTITNTGATMVWSNVDIKEMDLATAYDCSAITGLCGDAGGNTDITFTTADTNYWIGDTGNWSDSTQWSTTSGGSADGRVPLPQDDVVFDNGSFSGTSQIATLDMPRAGKSVDWSAYNEGQTPRMSVTVATTFYGSLTLVSDMTLTFSSTNFTFEGRGSFTLTTGGQTFASVTINMVGGTMTLQDALSVQTGGVTLNFTRGTLDANDFNVTAGFFVTNNSNTRVLSMGTGTWTITSTGAVWGVTATSLTLNEETSTIIISNTTATAKTFGGGGETYNNLTITGDDVTITGNNTFNILTQDNGGEEEGLIIGTGSTQTVTEFADGSSCQSGAVCLLFGVAGGGAETLLDSTGNNCVDWFTITNISGSGGAGWYAGANSTDGGGNLIWDFSACPEEGGGESATSSVKFKGGVKARGGVKVR